MIKINKHKILQFFGIDTDPIVGLDIGATGIKLMEFAPGGEALTVVRYHIEPLEPGIIAENHVIDRERLVAALKLAVQRSGIKTSKVCISLPNSIVVTKIIKVGANLSDKEIGNEIDLQADKHIPYPLTEVNLDYAVIGPVLDDDTLDQVQLVATKSENIIEIVTLLDEVGLVTSIIDIDSFAMMRAFELIARKLPNRGRDKTIALFDIGATMTTMQVFHNDMVVYSRDQAFGSQQLVDEVQNVYGLTYVEAVLNILHEELPKDYHPEILDPFKQAVSQQIQRFCQFFLSAGEYSTVDYIFITGGCSILLGLEQTIQQKTQIKTFIGNPFSEVKCAATVNKSVFEIDQPRLMKCCGLAMRNIKK